MKNLYQEILFECFTPKHKPIGGQMRFWHIFQQDCYPNGCESESGIHVPNLLVSEDEYQAFLKQFRKFRRWTKKMLSRLKVSFTGIIEHIHPHFSVSMVETSPIFKCEGFVLVFKECMIQNHFFEDPVYIFIDWDILGTLNLNQYDTVSGFARFCIDDRGVITLDRVSKMRLISSILPRKEWGAHKFDEFRLRMVDYLYQDFCLECTHQFLAMGGNIVDRKQTNIFVCTLRACIHQKKEDAKKSPPDFLPTLSNLDGKTSGESSLYKR